MEQKKFEFVSGGKETRKTGPEKKKLEIEALARDYECSIQDRPAWCVWGVDGIGGFGVLYWIKPVEEAKLVAYRMAKLISEIGGDATAEKTEWNPEMTEEPIYNKSKNMLHKHFFT